jgi:hypothetical protein
MTERERCFLWFGPGTAICMALLGLMLHACT